MVQTEELQRRAESLDLAGKTTAARDAYMDVLRAEPSHRGALLNLGTLLFNAGYRSAARLTYNELLKHHPTDVTGLINLANLELEEGHLEMARPLYDAALRADDTAALAHQGLSYVLDRLGEHERAQQHRAIGFGREPMIVVPYRGERTPVRVLLLLSPARANVATELVLDDTMFAVTKIFPEFFNAALPPHDVVFNAIGDVEASTGALDAALRLTRASDARVINPPERVGQTSRIDVARRLRGLENIIVPKIELVSREAVAKLSTPVLLRAPGFHTGEHFVLVERDEDLVAAVGTFPDGDVLAIEFLDARGSDGATRKYRVLFIDGVLYPMHLARASQWKVHYFTADLVSQPGAIDEETAFLLDPASALGTRAVRGLEAIRDEIELDYFGIDFALDRDGNVLVFEANATMKIVPPPENDPNPARLDAARAALTAARDLVVRRAGVVA